MEYKIKKQEIEELLENQVSEALLRGQNEIKSRNNAQEKLLEKINGFLPLTTELRLKHLDILLETTKSFLLISSTVFVTALAIDPSKVTNIDIALIRIISIVVLLISVVVVICILYKRNLEKKKILADVSFLRDRYNNLNKIEQELLDLVSYESKEKIKETARLGLKNNQTFNKYLPDDF